jgi:hypothetical protein
MVTGPEMALPGTSGEGLGVRPLQPLQAGYGATWRPYSDAAG